MYENITTFFTFPPKPSIYHVPTQLPGSQPLSAHVPKEPSQPSFICITANKQTTCRLSAPTTCTIPYTFVPQFRDLPTPYFVGRISSPHNCSHPPARRAGIVGTGLLACKQAHSHDAPSARLIVITFYFYVARVSLYPACQLRRSGTYTSPDNSALTSHVSVRRCPVPVSVLKIPVFILYQNLMRHARPINPLLKPLDLIMDLLLPTPRAPPHRHHALLHHHPLRYP